MTIAWFAWIIIFRKGLCNKVCHWIILYNGKLIAVHSRSTWTADDASFTLPFFCLFAFRSSLRTELLNEVQNLHQPFSTAQQSKSAIFASKIKTLLDMVWWRCEWTDAGHTTNVEQKGTQRNNKKKISHTHTERQQQWTKDLIRFWNILIYRVCMQLRSLVRCAGQELLGRQSFGTRICCTVHGATECLFVCSQSVSQAIAVYLLIHLSHMLQMCWVKLRTWPLCICLYVTYESA